MFFLKQKNKSGILKMNDNKSREIDNTEPLDGKNITLPQDKKIKSSNPFKTIILTSVVATIGLLVVARIIYLTTGEAAKGAVAFIIAMSAGVISRYLATSITHYFYFKKIQRKHPEKVLNREEYYALVQEEKIKKLRDRAIKEGYLSKETLNYLGDNESIENLKRPENQDTPTDELVENRETVNFNSEEPLSEQTILAETPEEKKRKTIIKYSLIGLGILLYVLFWLFVFQKTSQK